MQPAVPTASPHQIATTPALPAAPQGIRVTVFSAKNEPASKGVTYEVSHSWTEWIRLHFTSDCIRWTDDKTRGGWSPAVYYDGVLSPCGKDGCPLIAHRADAHVEAVTVGVIDIDAGPRAEVMALRAQLEAAGVSYVIHPTGSHMGVPGKGSMWNTPPVEGFDNEAAEAKWYASHPHREDPISVRVIFPLSRPVSREQYNEFYGKLLTGFEILDLSDLSTSNASCQYFYPTAKTALKGTVDGERVLSEFVVWNPTLPATGNTYTGTLDVDGILQVVEWSDRLAPPSSKGGRVIDKDSASEKAVRASRGDVEGAGKADAVIVSARAAQEALRAACEYIRTADIPTGERHRVIMTGFVWRIGKLCPHLLNPQHVYDELLAACHEMRNPFEPGRAETDIEKSLREAMTAAQKPELTDAGWAEQLLILHSADVRYVVGGVSNTKSGYFVVWDEARGIWDARDGVSTVHRWCRELLRDWKSRISQLLASNDDVDVQYGKKLLKFYDKGRSYVGGNAIVSCVAQHQDIRCTADAFDQNPNILVVKNGTVEVLPDGSPTVFRKSRREDMCTKMSEVEFDASAECPQWDTFLAEQYGESADFLMEAIGWTLTGIPADKFFVLRGPRRSGKGTVLRVIGQLVGMNVWAQAIDQTLLQRQRGVVSHAFANQMLGTRYGFIDEPKTNASLDAEMLKQITGGLDIALRGHHEAFVSRKIVMKLWFATNGALAIHDEETVVHSRMRVITSLVDHFGKEDRTLEKKFLSELSGILNRAIRAARAWHARGQQLVETEAVETAGEEDRLQSDPWDGFIDMCLEKVDLISGRFVDGNATYPLAAARGEWLSAGDIYKLYEAWVKGGHSTMTHTLGPKSLGKHLRQCGFHPMRCTASRGFLAKKKMKVGFNGHLQELDEHDFAASVRDKMIASAKLPS